MKLVTPDRLLYFYNLLYLLADIARGGCRVQVVQYCTVATSEWVSAGNDACSTGDSTTVQAKLRDVVDIDRLLYANALPR